MSSIAYLIWLTFHIDTPLGVYFFALELALFMLVFIFIFNHWSRKYELLGGTYNLRASVDVLIPTKNEPLDMLEKTIQAALEIEYPFLRVYVLDDGNRPKVAKLTEQLGAIYLSRPDATQKAFKAANMNYGFLNSHGTFILALDADHAVKPNILDDLLGHFKNNKVGAVASRQGFAIPKDDFNNDHLFYECMQAGKNHDGAAISCGSGVIYRRAALQKIGGFQEWNLVEDLYTTYVLNQHGYKVIYVNQSYSAGTAPYDLKGIYKQRGTWAQDTMRLFIWKSPLFARGLTLRQRMHYFEMGYSYLISAFVIPAFYGLNIYSLAADKVLINGGAWYVVARLPALYFTLKVYSKFGRGNSTSRMWAALFPVYFWASIKAITRYRTPYKVTIKTKSQPIRLQLIVPHILLFSAGTTALIYHLYHYGVTANLGFNLFWISLMCYWLWPVVGRALPKLNKRKVAFAYE